MKTTVYVGKEDKGIYEENIFANWLQRYSIVLGSRIEYYLDQTLDYKRGEILFNEMRKAPIDP